MGISRERIYREDDLISNPFAEHLSAAGTFQLTAANECVQLIAFNWLL